jgi:hypothetical protein
VVITIVITSKTQIKEKELKVKHWVISQECFFFNAVELGAESANQVISNEALRSIAEVFSIRHCIAST